MPTVTIAGTEEADATQLAAWRELWQRLLAPMSMPAEGVAADPIGVSGCESHEPKRAEAAA